jgi:chromosome segregation ATPase
MNYSLTAIAVLLLVAGAAFGQPEDQPGNKETKKQYLYGWTDSKGTLHITDGLGKIPERYRDKARKLESLKGQEPDADQQVRDAIQSGSDMQEAEDEARAEWQYRMGEWKKRLADAEKGHRALEQEKMDLTRTWGSIALAPAEHRQRAVDIELQMKALQAEIDTAKNMIDTVLPDEARKAGVPPGWLRQ